MVSYVQKYFRDVDVTDVHAYEKIVWWRMVEVPYLIDQRERKNRKLDETLNPSLIFHNLRCSILHLKFNV